MSERCRADPRFRVLELREHQGVNPTALDVLPGDDRQCWTTTRAPARHEGENTHSAFVTTPTLTTSPSSELLL
ncbi:hypothetical protein [Halorientalis sp.]|uniref:hypothetical protein n=1 Tax=Halorientalis sp. TaxID=1931229 RepID=UPI0026067C9A|nr:hypothetical protein [Halorientalis sp.]